MFFKRRPLNKGKYCVEGNRECGSDLKMSKDKDTCVVKINKLRKETSPLENDQSF